MGYLYDYIKKNKLLFLVILPAFIFHMAVILPSGTRFCFEGRCGLFFWGAHSHDAIWHLAITEVSFRQLPFIMPTFSGALLSGYNYFLDLIMYGLYLAKISPLFTYFKLFPVLWFITFTATAILAGRKLKDSSLFIGILLFFLFFAGSFSYLLTLYHQGTIWGSSGLLAMQSGLTLTNLQFAFSLVVLLVMIIIMRKDMPDSLRALLLGLLVFVNIALKFYGGIVGLFFVLMYATGDFLLKKKIPSFLLISAGAVFGAMLSIYLFYNPSAALESGSSFTFSPFSTIHPIIEDKAQFYMKDTVNARYFLMNTIKTDGVGPRIIWIEAMTMGLFLFFNFGTRIIGFIYLAKQLITRKINRLEVYIFLTIIFATILTALFVQKGIWWNTIQFFYYALFFMNFLAALAVYDLVKNSKTVKAILLTVIVLLTIPTSIDVFKGFTEFPAHSYISDEELKALKVLKGWSDGVVYTAPYNKASRGLFPSPLPLAVYDDTSYVSAFSGKQTYLADEVQLRLLGIPFEGRWQRMKETRCNDLQGITYVYHVKGVPNDFIRVCLPLNKGRFTKIYENREAIIYKIIQ